MDVLELHNRESSQGLTTVVKLVKESGWPLCGPLQPLVLQAKEGLEIGAGRGAAHRQERHVLGVQRRHDLGVDGTEAEVSKGCEWVRPVLWVEVTPGDSY